jgi:hypothetical protein
MTHQRVAGDVDEAAPRRSPDFEIGMAETFAHLADSGNMMKLQ